VSLTGWRANGWLREHRTSHSEIVKLLGAGDRDLADAATSTLSTDRRHNIAYEAALKFATAALAAAGYRATRESHHLRTSESLSLTIRADPATVRRLDRARQRRNVTEYEGGGMISEGEAGEVFRLAGQLRDRVRGWLEVEHPELM